LTRTPVKCCAKVGSTFFFMRKLNLLFQVGKNFVKYFDRKKLTEISFCANTLILLRQEFFVQGKVF
jgi:hypothetical protein